MKKIILLSSLITFVSCETNLNYKEYITNSSQKDVWIVLDSLDNLRANFLNKDSILLKSGETVLFFDHNELNGLTGEFENCDQFKNYDLDSNLVMKTTENPPKKGYEINNSQRWDFEITKDGANRNDDCQCTFEITDGMFN